MIKRRGGRAADALRPIKLTPNFTKYAEGSVLIEVGETKVICTASVEDRVPMFILHQNRGCVTAVYSTVPRGTDLLSVRVTTKGGPSLLPTNTSSRKRRPILCGRSS